MHLCIFVVTLLSIVLAVESHEFGVLSLNDDTFEHATQAASGQTTGYWLVYFGKTEDVGDQKIWEAFAEQQKEEHPWLLHAHIDIETSPKTAARFQVSHSPSFILFRNRKMYRYPELHKLIDPQVVAKLEAFTSGGWQNVAKEEVPKTEFSLGIPTSTLVLIVGGAALSSIGLAVVGDWYGRRKEEKMYGKPVKGQ